MVEIVWTEPALRSLYEIADHISLDNLKSAQALVEKVFDKVEYLKINLN